MSKERFKMNGLIYEYFWDEMVGFTRCTIIDGDNHYTATARCCLDDRDMKSEMTGKNLATMRAELKYWKGVKKELKIKQKFIHDFLNRINSSNKYNPKAYVAKHLESERDFYDDSVYYIDQRIKKMNDDIKKFIDDKEKCYQRMRANRRTETDN